MAESKEELKSLLMKVKEESEKAGLKFSIQKTKIMTSGLITSWHVDGNNGNSQRFIFLSSKITMDGESSHKIKRHLLLGRKVMTNLDSTLKSRDITLPIKVHTVKAVFSSNHIRMWMLSCKELMLLDFSAGEDSWESLELQGDQAVSPKGNQSWIFMEGLMLNWSSNILTIWCEEQTH